MSTFFEDMITEALSKVREKSIDIFTFAFYHDHESACVSICIDTEESSVKTIKSSNEFSRIYFYENLIKGDLDSLGLFNFQTGRSFSLGDYAYCNIIYKSLPAEYMSSNKMYLEMIQAINLNKENILKCSSKPENVFYCCSSENNEVEYIWQ